MPMNPDCLTCPYREEVSELKTKYSTSRKELYGRIEALEQSQVRTNEQYKGLKEDIKDLKDQQEKDFNELKKQQQTIIARIDSLSQQPGKRWDTAITVTITAIITTVINIASKFFGGAT